MNKIVNGEIVAMTSEEEAALIASMAPTKAEAVAVRLAAVDDLFSAKIAAGLAYSDKVLQIAAKDRNNISDAVVKALAVKATASTWPDGFQWRMADDSFLAIADADAMIALGDTAFAYYDGLLVVRWTHIDALTAVGADDGKSVDDVTGYDISTGWPG